MRHHRSGPFSDHYVASEDQQPALVLTGITKSFGGVEALRGASLRCWRGQVHGLVGENGAGKSTLVKILAGAITADAGEMHLDGNRLQLRNPSDAWRVGIGTVFQELSLIPDLSVAMNLFYGIEPNVTLGRIGMRSLRSAAREILNRYGFRSIDPEQTVRELSLAERQIVEIIKVLMRNPQVFVLDEATSALPPEDVEWLFKVVKEFANRGGIALFISHRLAEIQALCDHITVFRAGADVGSGPATEMPADRLVELMLGRKVERFYPPRATVPDRETSVICELQQFAVPPRLHAIDLKLCSGEIVGVGGLQGQGQRDLFLGLYGARHWTGRLLIHGKPAQVHSPSDAIRVGIGFVPEDRASEGLCLPLSVRDNIALGILDKIAQFGFVKQQVEQRLISRIIQTLRIKLRHPLQEVAALSGGNQQKVLLGRVLARDPLLLLMYDATRGVDVGTKAEIYHLMRDQCAKGVAILFYSTDVSELANMADRVLVLHDGKVCAHLSGANLTEQNIVAAAVGGQLQGTSL